MQSRPNRLVKVLKSKIGKGFTLMMVPNSGGAIKSYRLPFSFVLIILAVIICNIYVFTGFISQVWSIHQFKQALNSKDQQIYQLLQDQKKIKPTLQKSYQITEELNRLRQERLKILDKWKSLQPQKSGPVSYPVSRGAKIRYSGYQLSELKSDLLKSDELAILNQNMAEISQFIKYESIEQQLLSQALVKYQRRLDRIPSINPIRVSRITSWFGRRLHPKLRYSRLHTGIDLRARSGTKVVTTADGQVSFAGYKKGYGYTVIIDHAEGYQTLYAHNSKLIAEKGQVVKRGTLICYSGNSGTSTGPHLHYEVRVNGKPVNPSWFLNN